MTNEKGIPLVKGKEPACDFIKNDEKFYPYLLKTSDVPQPGTCPIPKANYTITDFVVPLDVLPNVTPGKYELKVSYTTQGKQIGGYTIKSSYKYQK